MADGADVVRVIDPTPTRVLHPGGRVRRNGSHGRSRSSWSRRRRGLAIAALGICVALSAACGGAQPDSGSSVSLIRSAQGHVHFHVHVPHEVPPGFSFGFVDQPITIHGYQAVGIDYSNAEPLSILVKEYAPGLSPSIADPQTGVVRVDGDTWKLYGKTPALVRTFADGVTIEVDGAEGAPRRDLLILARGLR